MSITNCPNKSTYCTQDDPCESCSLDRKEEDSWSLLAIHDALIQIHLDGWEDVAVHFTCREVEALASALEALDLDDQRDALLRGHELTDEPGDLHYVDPLLYGAEKVIESWETGNLAESVRDLAELVAQIRDCYPIRELQNG